MAIVLYVTLPCVHALISAMECLVQCMCMCVIFSVSSADMHENKSMCVGGGGTSRCLPGLDSFFLYLCLTVVDGIVCIL